MKFQATSSLPAHFGQRAVFRYKYGGSGKQIDSRQLSKRIETEKIRFEQLPLKRLAERNHYASVARGLTFGT